MCPACLATISMIVAGAISTGGVTALAVKRFGRKKVSGEASGVDVIPSENELQSPKEKENEA
jgi:hypothetical protein